MRPHSQMRIIAGSAKGRRIACPPGEEVRPTPERMRGALFNILGEEVRDASVLDLFAGTGSLGLEALSRGAGHVVFVEIGFGPLQVLRQNLDALGFAEQATVLPRDVFHLLTHLEDLGRKYDLVLAAPPYALLEGRFTAERLFRVFNDVLAACGRPQVSLNLQHSPSSHVPDETPALKCSDRRQYGQAELSRFQLKAAGADGESVPSIPSHQPG